MPSQSIKLVGSLTAGPPSSSTSFPTLSAQLNLAQEQTRQIVDPGARSIASPSTFVDLLASSGITTLTVVAFRINSGNLDIRMTTSGGTDQIIRCSSLYVWMSPNAGDGATALAIQGTADFEMLLAGD